MKAPILALWGLLCLFVIVRLYHWRKYQKKVKRTTSLQLLYSATAIEKAGPTTKGQFMRESNIISVLAIVLILLLVAATLDNK